MFPVLIYDGDCAFCTRAAEWTKAHVRPDATIFAYQTADLWALGVNPQACQRSVQWVQRPCTEALTEGSAIAAVLKSGRRPWRWVGRILEFPGVSRLADFIYRRVSANRHRLPGGSSACKVNIDSNVIPLHRVEDTIDLKDDLKDQRMVTPSR